MATTVIRAWDPGEVTGGQSGSAQLPYYVTGTDDAETAKDAVEAEIGGTIPETYDDLLYKHVAISDYLSDQLDGCFVATVHYGKPESGRSHETGDSFYSFKVGGGTRHITQSIQTIGSYVAAGNAPDFKGAIGYSKEHGVAGVDIPPAPDFAFSETHFIADATVTGAYKGKLHDLAYHTADDTFKGLDIGEALFLGAEGSQRGDGSDWEIRFDFGGSPNKINIPVGDITVVTKLGWHYLWVLYEPGKDENVRIQVPRAAYVEKIFEVGDFEDLGIGV